MNRVYNFSAGPSMLPEEVLKEAQSELLNYNATGMSVMEISHRSDIFKGIIEKAESDLRDIMNIPQNYRVLFLQGGAYTQFSMIPLNLLNGTGKADYINTGYWSTKAINEAKKYGEISVVASSKDKNFNYIPDIEEIKFSPEADYVHITMNNTISGTRFNRIPETKVLVSDMSTYILSEEIDIKKYGLIYAGAQKNMGPAGLTIVIVRGDLVGHARNYTPIMLDYQIHVDKKSAFNTPPCYSIYIAGLVFKWIKKQGGINVIAERNRKKAGMLYECIDNSKIFKGTARENDRSIMNVTFVLPTEELTKKFLREAALNGLVTLGGHRSVGGIRASIYNAMPVEGVKKLTMFMENFEKENN